MTSPSSFCDSFFSDEPEATGGVTIMLNLKQTSQTVEIILNKKYVDDIACSLSYLLSVVFHDMRFILPIFERWSRD